MQKLVDLVNFTFFLSLVLSMTDESCMAKHALYYVITID